jgi:hypothetical protein
MPFSLYPGAAKTRRTTPAHSKADEFGREEEKLRSQGGFFCL